MLIPTYLTLASQIAITAIFAVSLDLILGYAGLVSLGHAAYFGLGAYTAGLIAKAGWGEPFSGLLLAAAASGLFGYLTGFIVVRVRHLALIMITLGIGLLLYEVANRESWLTGGNDGLQGVAMWPLFGWFDFDLYGYTAYAYALAVLLLVVLAARRLVHSPFGLSLRAIRENERRMPAIGAPSRGTAAHGLYDCRYGRRHCRWAACADHGVRLTGRAELRTIGGTDRYPGDRRDRPAVWRYRRRHRLHGGARPAVRHESAILVFLDRPDADRRRAVPAERHTGRPGQGNNALSTTDAQRMNADRQLLGRWRATGASAFICVHLRFDLLPCPAS